MSETVCVACKLPNGLLLRTFAMDDFDEPVMGGGFRTVKRARQDGGPIKIHGNAAPFGQMPAVPVQGGYALTPNIDAGFWAKWLAQNEGSDLVRNKLVFAHEKQEFATRRAGEQAAVRSGLEQLDPAKLPRGIETAKAA